MITRQQLSRGTQMSASNDIFKSLSVNMISTNHLEDDGEDTFKSEELIHQKSIRGLNT